MLTAFDESFVEPSCPPNRVAMPFEETGVTGFPTAGEHPEDDSGLDVLPGFCPAVYPREIQNGLFKDCLSRTRRL